MSGAGFLYHTHGDRVEILVNASSVKLSKAKGTLGQVGVQGELLPNSPLNFTLFDQRVFLQRHRRSVRIFLADALDLLVEFVPYVKSTKQRLGHPPFVSTAAIATATAIATTTATATATATPSFVCFLSCCPHAPMPLTVPWLTLVFCLGCTAD